MLFNSLEFALFLPLFFILYWFVFQRNLKMQNLFIVVASYIFYGWWDWRFLILIAFTSLCSFLSGVLIERARSKNPPPLKDRAKLVMISNIAINLLVLGYYKYFNFFIDSFASAFTLLGSEFEYTGLSIILPVGISFYTFQALSYTIDVYRKDITPTKSIINFFAYVSFFPQLVAGPIERATTLLPQFYQPRSFDYAKAVDGCRQILWGLFKKMIIADRCAIVVNEIWDTYPDQSSGTLIIGAIFFSFQIYGDFSGYSDIAIGTARLFGFNLMRNFNFPYFSRDIAEFWRRWHISLTTWFRDYIYIPLGGSRGSKGMIFRNTLIIFLVSGFWHGANWTFVAWGAYHALLFLPLMLLSRNRRNTNIVAQGRILPSLKELAQMLLTFTLATIGWIIFRAESIGQALEYMGGICSFSGEMKYIPLTNILFIGIFLVIEWLQRDKQHALQLQNISISKYMLVRYAIYLILIVVVLLFQGTQGDFIYFQF